MTDWTQLQAQINTAINEAGTTLEAACEATGVDHSRFTLLLDTRPWDLEIDDMHLLAKHTGTKVSAWLNACGL